MPLTGDAPACDVARSAGSKRSLLPPLPRLPLRFSISAPALPKLTSTAQAKRPASAAPRPRGIPGQDPGELRIRAAAARKRAFELESYSAGNDGNEEGEIDENEMAELLHQIDYECQDLFEAEKNGYVGSNLQMEDEDEDGEMVVLTKFGQKGDRLQPPMVGAKKEVRRKKSFAESMFGRKVVA
ncbi:MAG: hypothetical protein Q9183_002478 [Haloplaca sp. 2 TL-2023]